MRFKWRSRTEDDIDEPPMFATMGAERCTARNAPKNGAGTWATFVRIDKV